MRLVDYTLAKRAKLTELRGGGLSRDDLCDAHPQLRPADPHVGEADPPPGPRGGPRARAAVAAAPPELLRAARNVGEQIPTPCPVCAAEPLVHVTYVFGDALRQANGRVWPRNSLADLHRSMDEVACYVVEVCTACYWNHLAQRYLLGRRHGGWIGLRA